MTWLNEVYICPPPPSFSTGDIGQVLVEDVPASGPCDLAGKSGIEGLGDSDDAGTDPENSVEDPKSSPESDQHAEDSPLDSHVSRQLDTNVEKPSQEELDGKPSQEEFTDKDQKDEADAKQGAHAADVSNAGDGEDADDKPLVLDLFCLCI